MQSKTSYFSGAMFRKNISRFYLLAILYALVQCLVLALSLHINLSVNYGVKPEYASRMYDAVNLIYTTTQVTSIIAMCGACVATLAVFSYLYSASSANMMSALPIRREALFTSAVASIFAIVIIGNVLAGILALLVTITQGLNLGFWILQWIFIQIGQFSIYFGIAVLSAVITGNIVAMPLIYCLINFAAVIFGSAICFMISTISYGITVYVPDWVLLLSPTAQYMSSSPISYAVDLVQTYSDMSYSMTNATIGYFFAGFVLIFLAFFIHKKRRMETAGDVVSVKILKPIFKIIVTAGAAFVLTAVLYGIFFTSTESDLLLIGCIFPCTLIGYIVADMLINKRSKIVIKKVMPVALGCAFALTGSAYLLELDVFGAERYVPEDNEISAVNIYASGSFYTTNPEMIAQITDLHELTVANKDIYEDNYNTRLGSLRINYELTDGSVVNRYYVTASDDSNAVAQAQQLLSDIQNSSESIAYRKNLEQISSASSVGYGTVSEVDMDSFTNGNYEYYGTYEDNITLSAEEAEELLNECIIPDMNDGNIGLLQFEGAEYDFEFYANAISLELYTKADFINTNTNTSVTEYPTAEYSNYNHSYFSTSVTTKSWRTIAWLEEHGVELTLKSELPIW